MTGEVRELTIHGLGHRGDGIAKGPHGDVYVPYVLPGEQVRVELDGNRGHLIEVLCASEYRQPPICEHFTFCGGCAMQHMRDTAYRDWKADLVRNAFAARGISVEVANLHPLEPATRRRCTLSARRTKKGVKLGFHSLRGDEIVPLKACPVLRPGIAGVLPKLARHIAPVLSRKGRVRIAVTETDTGLDVDFHGIKSRDDRATQIAFANIARALDIARISISGEPAITRREPVITIAGVVVHLPPGSFLQATKESEEALVAIVREACARCDAIADLYCGLGTFTIPLAREHAVTAAESEGRALDALRRALRVSSGLKPVRLVERDLTSDPLTGLELAGLDAVVFDPPRAGAAAQAQALSCSDVSVIVAVSCNPATLARDARILIDGAINFAALRRWTNFSLPHMWKPWRCFTDSYLSETNCPP